MEYEFTFVVSGVDVNDDSIAATLMDQLDALLARAGGVDLLVMTESGADSIDAARTAVLKVKYLVPDLQVLRLDRDLVGITEIAERAGRSRQNVTQWVNGERRAGIEQPFPAPEGTVGRARVWLWAEVNAWLRHLGLGDKEVLPTRAEMNDIDYMLRHNRLLPLDRPRTELNWHELFRSPPSFTESHFGNATLTRRPIYAATLYTLTEPAARLIYPSIFCRFAGAIEEAPSAETDTQVHGESTGSVSTSLRILSGTL